MKLLLTSCVLGAALLAGCATQPAPDTPTRTVDGVLIGPSGRTLYTFAPDASQPGQSSCTGTCAAQWPPLLAPATAKPIGGYTLIQRGDGQNQWAYKGAPLYHWSKDSKAGDRGGDGQGGGQWRLARP